MTRSLDMNATDELIWNTVLDVISNSSILKEKVKWESLGKDYEKTKLVEQDISSLNKKIRAQKKLETKYQHALAELETNRILKQISPNERSGPTRLDRIFHFLSGSLTVNAYAALGSAGRLSK